MVNLDTGWGMPKVEEMTPEKFVDAHMDYLTGQKGSQVDSIWWCWGEMTHAPYPSKILPVMKGDYQKWLKQGLDPIPISIERCRKKHIEAFYSFRIHGGDETESWTLPPVLVEHPEWGIPSPYWPKPWMHFNFTLKEVRQYKLDIIREVAERYDFDGIEIDWRCGLTTLPVMHAWENRDSLTTFMRSVREMLQQVAKKRGRPFLLAARVPENIEGCHYDGIDVERWVKENLVDVLALGCKSYDIDLNAFKRLTQGTHIKLYPSLDDHHRASGYEEPTVEMYRGVASTYWQQGADGIYAFNWYPVPIILDERANPKQEKIRRQTLCEMGSLKTLDHKDKTFFTPRRGGGGWYDTAEYFYANTSAFAQLPKELSNNPSDEAYVFVQVGDDVNALASDIEQLELRVLLTDAAKNPAPVVDQLRLRINGVIMDPPRVSDGWLVYKLKPVYLALGSNVVALKLNGRDPQAKERISVEKMAIDVRYKK